MDNGCDSSNCDGSTDHSCIWWTMVVMAATVVVQLTTAVSDGHYCTHCCDIDGHYCTHCCETDGQYCIDSCELDSHYGTDCCEIVITALTAVKQTGIIHLLHWLLWDRRSLLHWWLWDSHYCTDCCGIDSHYCTDCCGIDSHYCTDCCGIVIIVLIAVG